MSKTSKNIIEHNLIKYLTYENNKWDIDQNLSDLFLLEKPEYYIFVSKQSNKFFDVSDLILAKFPFVQDLRKEVIENILSRNNLIKQQIKNSILSRNSAQLRNPQPTLENKNILKYVKTLIKNLNGFIYKNKINEFILDSAILNKSNGNNYISFIEFICSNGQKNFLCLFKFSRSPFLEKYKYEAELYKKALANINVVIDKIIILNVFAEQLVVEI